MTDKECDNGVSLGRVTTYGLAAFAATGTASGAVVSVDLSGLPQPLSFPTFNVIDLDGDSLGDISINLADYGTTYQEKQFQPLSGGTFINTSVALGSGGGSGNRDYVQIFAPGDVIGPGTANFATTSGTSATNTFQLDDVAGYYVGTTPANRPYVSLTNGIIGFTFTADAAGTATNHFGYVDLTYADGADDPAFQSPITVNGVFFESTPDTAITVIPEPGSLALLAAGAVGVASYRRRRDVA